MKKQRKTIKKEKLLKPAGLMSLEEVSFALEAGFDFIFSVLHEAANCEHCHEKEKK